MDNIIHFLEKETRCDFEVSPMMKRCWAAQLKVLAEVDRICQKYGIRYFAADGTLLGAVRHGGYIPWDDDLDIGMLRPDYMRFLSVAPLELEKPYHLAAYTTDADHEEPLSCVVNRSDVGEDEELNEIFYGCPFIVGTDIIPFDFMPASEEERGIQISLFQLAANIISFYDTYDRDGSLEERIVFFENASGVAIDRDASIRQQLGLVTDSIAAMYSREESGYIAHLYEYARMEFDKVIKYDISWFSDFLTLPFEYTNIPVCLGYRSFLSSVYGDYDKPIYYAATHEYPFYKQQIPYMSEAVKERYKDLLFGE